MKTAKSIAIVLLVTTLLYACVGCTKIGKDEQNSEPSASTQKFTSDTVIKELQSHAAEYGFENALSELQLASEMTVDDDTYYRMQQYYQGVPVYGREAVCVIDAEGNQIAQSGNLLDVSDSLSMECTVTQTQLMKQLDNYVQTYFGSDESVFVGEISNDSTTVFFDESGTAHLALIFQASIGEMPYRVLSDGHDGTVLLCSPFLNTETVIGYKASDETSKQQGFPIEQHDNGYYLENNARKTFVRNLDGSPITTGKNVDYTHTINSSTPVESQDNIFGNTNEEIKNDYEFAADLMLILSSVQDYYKDNLGFSLKTEKTFLFYNDSWSNGTNTGAALLSKQLNPTVPENGISLITWGQSHNLDFTAMAHEYTHLVSDTLVDWSINKGENGALVEAFSDIFSVLITSKTNGIEPQWTLGERDLTNPGGKKVHDSNGKHHQECRYKLEGLSSPENHEHNSNCLVKLYYPATYNDEYYYPYADNHANSVLISHAAYLMYNGIDGTDSKKLTVDQLEKLWYRAMLTLPSDCDFARCRTCVEAAAKSVNLTYEQIACVKEAFDKVGIAEEYSHFDYVIGPNSTLSVLDQDGEPYDSFACRISGTMSKRVDLENRSFMQTYLDNTTEPLPLPKNEGTYTIKIYDKKDSPESMEFRIKVDPYESATELKIATNYINTKKVLSLEMLLATWFRNDIQCECYYRFNADGTCDEYFGDYSGSVNYTALSYSRTWTYSIDGDTLHMYSPNGYLADMKCVTKKDPIDWDWSISDLQRFDDDEIFLYEVDYVRPTDPYVDSNALYFKTSVPAGSEGAVPKEEFLTQIVGKWNSDNSDVYYFKTDGSYEMYTNGNTEPQEKGTMRIVDENAAVLYPSSTGDNRSVVISADGNMVFVGYNIRQQLTRAEDSENQQSQKYAGVPEPYASFLRNKEYEKDSYGEMSGYCLYDINQDGKDELILEDLSVGSECLLYTCDTAGKVTYVGLFTSMSSLQYSPQSRTLTTWWRSMNNGNVTIMYSISALNGTTLENVAGFTYDATEDKYYDNDTGKTLSKADCEKYIVDTITFDFIALED